MNVSIIANKSHCTDAQGQVNNKGARQEGGGGRERGEELPWDRWFRPVVCEQYCCLQWGQKASAMSGNEPLTECKPKGGYHGNCNVVFSTVLSCQQLHTELGHASGCHSLNGSHDS